MPTLNLPTIVDGLDSNNFTSVRVFNAFLATTWKCDTGGLKLGVRFMQTHVLGS